VEIMAAHRAPYQEPDAFGGTPEERSEAISIYFSYSGPFERLSDREGDPPHRGLLVVELDRQRPGVVGAGSGFC
jgi:hypothetical protein